MSGFFTSVLNDRDFSLEGMTTALDNIYDKETAAKLGGSSGGGSGWIGLVFLCSFCGAVGAFGATLFHQNRAVGYTAIE